MNSMVAAYHETKDSVSSEKDLERKRSKKKSKSVSDRGEPSSTIEENTVFDDGNSSIEVHVEGGGIKLEEKATTIESEQRKENSSELRENVTATEDEQGLLEQTTSSNQQSITEEVSLSEETKHTLDSTDEDLDHDHVSHGSISPDKKQNADSEQTLQEPKRTFYLSRSSAEVGCSEADEKPPAEPVIVTSTQEPRAINFNTTSNAKENKVDIPPPFSKFVDMNRLHEALSAEKLHVEHGHLTEDMLKHSLKKKDDKSLKLALRQNHWGADNEIRGLLWPLFCKHFHKAHEDDTYDEFAKDMFAPASPGSGSGTDDIPLPPFVDYTHIECFNLSTEGLTLSKKITCVIEHTNPDITYCPLLIPLVSLFLHYMDPPTAYNCAYSLLRQKEDAFIPQTNVSFEASKFVVKDLAKKYAKHCYNHLARNSSNFETFFNDWLWWIICDLPFPYLVRVVDCFISEGFKVFYRVVLAILIIYAKYHAKKSSKPVPDILNHIRKFIRELPVTVDKLLKVGFSIKGLSRKEVKKLLVKHTMYINSVRMVHAQTEQNSSRGLISRSFSGPNARGVQIPMSRSFSGPVLLQQQLNSSIVELEMLYSIWTWLPTRYAVCQPLLLYTSDEHGTSLVTLYSRVENYQPTVIVIKNTEDEIFGAFCSAYWRERKQSTKNLSYFGTGETFIFTLAPEKKKYDWVGLKEESISNTSHMFQAGDRHVLTVGGGHGEAILLDENLLHCRTEHCDTFANEPLCDKKDFTCKVVEVYGFQ